MRVLYVIKRNAHTRHRLLGTRAHLSRRTLYDCARVAQSPVATTRTRSQCSAAGDVVRRPNVDPMGSAVRFAVYCTCQWLRRITTQQEPRHCSGAHIAEIASRGPRALGIPFHCRDNTDRRSHTGNCRLARPSELKGFVRDGRGLFELTHYRINPAPEAVQWAHFVVDSAAGPPRSFRFSAPPVNSISSIAPSTPNFLPAVHPQERAWSRRAAVVP